MIFFKKLITGITLMLFVLAIFGGMTFLQALPFIIFFALAYFNIKEEKDNKLWICLLAFFMAFINASINGVLDTVVWSVIFFIFLF